ncbi:MAG: HupE/UreJ family protein [Devosiaceae bacterium]|nr:HupE/UreJ family protein [Devosiaceae bacterium]
MQPAIVDLAFADNGSFELLISLDLEVVLAVSKLKSNSETPDFYESEYARLRSLGAEQLKEEFNLLAQDFLAGFSLRSDQGKADVTIIGVEIPEPASMGLIRTSIISLEGKMPQGAKNFVWEWEANFGPSTINIAGDGENEAYSASLLEGQKSDATAIEGPRQRSLVQIILNYIGIGYVHILPKGVDHILFVVGLFLLSSRLHALVWQISAFTLAHTITLALGMTGMVAVSAAIVEPLIALSIVYVCVENIFTQKLSRWRPIVVFGFGLLHGLGFAGVLKEIGLPANEFVAGLISFNVGVELGQLSIIAICFLLVGFWFSKKDWYRAYIVIPGSIAIGSIGGWWFVERIFFV